jgi:hypothetical protein
VLVQVTGPGSGFLVLGVLPLRIMATRLDERMCFVRGDISLVMPQRVGKYFKLCPHPVLDHGFCLSCPNEKCSDIVSKVARFLQASTSPIAHPSRCEIFLQICKPRP